MRIYIVGEEGEDHNYIIGAHRTYDGALKAWNEVRKDLLDRARHSDSGGTSRQLQKDMIKNLSCEDPKKIDNFPHAIPYIQEYELVD
ncbi:hypothetical protein COT47_01795 [Candidatus Woesearchaeota archaeon CG08_land_8_20_14_0_20_43_7]|nr:MAG: hypothetical protein COT47_01795 [Candidatus Woesearchaeota archaeon CG08_land_8_20_14_0_20_43_7]